MNGTQRRHTEDYIYRCTDTLIHQLAYTPVFPFYSLCDWLWLRWPTQTTGNVTHVTSTPFTAHSKHTVCVSLVCNKTAHRLQGCAFEFSTVFQIWATKTRLSKKEHTQSFPPNTRISQYFRNFFFSFDCKGAFADGNTFLLQIVQVRCWVYCH